MHSLFYIWTVNRNLHQFLKHVIFDSASHLCLDALDCCAPLSGQALLTGKEKHTSAMRSVPGKNAGKKPLCWGLGHHVVCWLSNLIWNVLSHYLLITCPKMRNILGVAPADLWLKNFTLESPRSSVISRRAAKIYLPPPLWEADIT